MKVVSKNLMDMSTQECENVDTVDLAQKISEVCGVITDLKRLGMANMNEKNYELFCDLMVRVLSMSAMRLLRMHIAMREVLDANEVGEAWQIAERMRNIGSADTPPISDLQNMEDYNV